MNIPASVGSKGQLEAKVFHTQLVASGRIHISGPSSKLKLAQSCSFFHVAWLISCSGLHLLSSHCFRDPLFEHNLKCLYVDNVLCYWYAIAIIYNLLWPSTPNLLLQIIVHPSGSGTWNIHVLPNVSVYSNWMFANKLYLCSVTHFTHFTRVTLLFTGGTSIMAGVENKIHETNTIKFLSILLFCGWYSIMLQTQYMNCHYVRAILIRKFHL